MTFSQSLIRVVFSKEKMSYLNHPDNINGRYESNFLQNIVFKCLSQTRETYGDTYSNLFRKDEIYDDIIKYMFYVFGNNMMIKSFGNFLK
jgi:hypothetical protein